jgi:hypothetical protein
VGAPCLQLQELAGIEATKRPLAGPCETGIQPLISMAHIFLAIFLIVFGLNVILGLSLPGWVLGGLALVAGILLLVRRFTIVPKP